jgi:CheY-like chemotaxis protein
MSVPSPSILIADDDPRIRELLKSFLADLNAQFIECADGVEAVLAYRQYHPDWALMDLQMGGLDGITATQAITESFPEARVLIVTQFEGPQLRKAAREAGACGYVLKDNLHRVRDFVLGSAEREALKG